LDRIEAMSILVAVVEKRSFTAAARALGMPLPTVSRRLAELESHLGTRLLNRSTRRLTLTDAGSAYLSACRRILEDIGEVERKVAGEYVAPKGELVVSAPIVFGRLHVVPIVGEFLSNYQDINIRLLLSDRNVHLLDDEIDLAVRIGRLHDSSMVATQVGTVRQVVCGSPGYFAAHGIPRVPRDLQKLSCITFDVLNRGATWSFAGKGRHVVQMRSRLSVNTAEAAIDAAAAGVGVTRVLSYQVAGMIANGKLQTVLDAYEPAGLPVSIIYPSRDMLPLKTRSFIDFASPKLRSRILRIDNQMKN
jgi:DNA-binding transcriptional LysR family regulator